MGKGLGSVESVRRLAVTVSDLRARTRVSTHSDGEER